MAKKLTNCGNYYVCDYCKGTGINRHIPTVQCAACEGAGKHKLIISEKNET